MITQTKTIWRKVKLGEVLEKVIDNRGKTPPLSKSGYPMIEVFQLSRDRKYPDISDAKKQKFVSEDTYNTWFRSGHPKEGDILVSTVGTIAQWDLIPKNKKYCIAQNVVALRPDLSKTTSEFLRFYFNQRKFVSQVEGIVIGATQPSVRLPHFLNLEIEIPPLDIQKRIADILSVFDDKIELNNKISRALEQMAQAIFKEWFVNQPEGDEIPLFELAKFTNGGAFARVINRNRQGLPLVKIAELNRGITDNTEWIDKPVDTKYYIDNGDLLFSWSGTVDIFIWDKGKAILNQHIFRVIPKQDYSAGFLYYVIRSKLPFFKHMAGAKATTMGHIKKEHLEEQSVIVAKDKDQKIFEDFYKKMVEVRLESQKLAALRDLLLPKLMSREIRV